MDTFISGGVGFARTWFPKFTYHGFRYIEITGFPFEPILDMVSGVFVHQAIKEISGFSCSDERVSQLFKMGQRSTWSNLMYMPTDCPSRERAGWLCDSFFIGRMEHFFTGQSIMERCFLENFLLAEKFDCIPEGMLPCAYPADFYDGLFIPNWSLWFVVQLKDQLDRTGDLAFVSQFKEKLYALLRYFSDFSQFTLKKSFVFNTSNLIFFSKICNFFLLLL